MLYMAMKIHHPELTQGLTREHMVRWLGYSLREDGGVETDKPFAYTDLIRVRFNEVSSNKIPLIEAAKAAMATMEGRRHVGPEIEPF